VTLVFDYCVVTVADGWHTLVYSRRPADSGLIDAAVASAENKIKANDWYRINQDRFMWEDKFAKCMVIPGILASYQELVERG
jgi:hypothetical protein